MKHAPKYYMIVMVVCETYIKVLCGCDGGVKHTPKYYDVIVDGLFALKDKSKPVKPFKLTFLSADIFFSHA